MLTSKSSLSYVLCYNFVNFSHRMESKVSFGIKILWAIRWLWKVPLYVLQKPRKWQKESGPSDMGHPVLTINSILSILYVLSILPILNIVLTILSILTYHTHHTQLHTIHTILSELFNLPIFWIFISDLVFFCKF